ncbi:hypothetical protein GEMRC1_005001 [Eukaryota sp. GEM-RC1]
MRISALISICLQYPLYSCTLAAVSKIHHPKCCLLLFLLQDPLFSPLLNNYSQVACLSVLDRFKNVPKVQQILTDYGCNIQARIGLHETDPECSTKGLIILAMDTRNSNMSQRCLDELNSVQGVSVKTVEFD